MIEILCMNRFPTDFEQYTRQLMGNDSYEALAKALCTEPPTSIRINPFKQSLEGKDIPLKDGNVAWCSNGIYLKEHPNFTFDPMFHAGHYYVQEASSMFLHHIISQLVTKPVTMLDLCAAPGGKSTLARTALRDGSLLICNEPNSLRASILSENIQKFGHPDVMVCQNYPHDFKQTGMQFDVILADVPCSGEGMFRKDTNAIAEWSKQNIMKCQQLQRKIIADIWPCLKQDGLLIYSTCTFNALENEENVEWITTELNAETVEIGTEKEWGIAPAFSKSITAYRFLPGRTRGEGLFMAVLRKTSDHHTKEEKRPNRNRKERNNSKNNNPLSPYRHWLNDRKDYQGYMKGNELIAIPSWWQDKYELIARRMHVVHAGIAMGTVKGKELIPHPSLALSTEMNSHAFHKIGLDYGQAINYLRKETIGLDSDTQKGAVLITYNNIPIGFGKKAERRINNLYPAQWKIKTTYIPNDKPIIIT